MTFPRFENKVIVLRSLIILDIFIVRTFLIYYAHIFTMRLLHQ